MINIETNDKKIGIRVVLFIVAVVIAVVSFSKAFLSLDNTKPGWTTLSAAVDADAPFYSKEYEMHYCFSGSKSEIKDLKKQAEAEYSAYLLRLYKLFDPKNEYQEFVNVATINNNPGKELVLEPDLYNAVIDAYEKTLQGKGFNLFSGALYAEWDSIINAADPTEFDPYYNQNESIRIKALSETVCDLDNFKIDKGSKEYSVIFTISDQYKKFAEEYEIESAPLDFNILKNAYILDCLKKEMADSGFSNGYIISSDGLLVKMASEEISYNLFGFQFDDSKDAFVSTVALSKQCQISSFNAFPLSDDDSSAYIIEQDGSLLFRNKYFDISSGFHNNIITSSYCKSDTLSENISDLCYANIVLYNADNEDEVKKEIESISTKYRIEVYTKDFAYLGISN